MIRFQFVLFIIFSLVVASNSTLLANETSYKPQRTFVLNAFKKATQLNEDFKHSVETASAAVQLERRKKVEKYQENELASALKDCVSLLSSGDDVLLAHKILELILAFENSADETMSFAFGEIFLNNPALIENAFESFNRKEKRYLYKQLQWGFQNTTYQKKVPKTILEDRLEKLKQVEININQ